MQKATYKLVLDLLYIMGWWNPEYQFQNAIPFLCQKHLISIPIICLKSVSCHIQLLFSFLLSSKKHII